MEPENGNSELITLTLNRDDRELLLKHVPGLDEEIRAQLWFAGAGKITFEIEVSQEQLVRMTQAFEHVFLSASEELQDKLRELVVGFFEQVDETLLDAFQRKKDAPSVPSEVYDEIRRLVMERNPATIDEANEIAREVSEAYNNRPQAELGGHSPGQVNALLSADWEGPESAVVLHEEALTLSDLAEINIITGARLLLQFLVDEGGTKATKNGNLNRKFVRKMMDRMASYDKGIKDRLHHKDVWNEEDVPSLADLRYVLLFGKLIRKHKGAFHVTKLGQKLLEEDNAGKLYAHLFRTFFITFDLIVLDGVGECPGLQETIAYSFSVIKKSAGDWVLLDDILPVLFLPGIARNIPVSNYSGTSYAPIVAETRVLRPLKRFGLVETRREKRDDPTDWQTNMFFRKTSLFDTFIEIRLDADHTCSETSEIHADEKQRFDDYQRLREALKSLSSRLLNFERTHSRGRDALLVAAKYLGYNVEGKNIYFPDSAGMDQLMDFFIYEPTATMRSVAQRYLDTQPDIPSDEYAVLEAAADSSTSLYQVIEAQPKKSRLLVRDLLHDRDDFWIMDSAMSATAPADLLIFMRVFHVGDISFSSGATIPFPLSDKDYLLAQCEKVRKIKKSAMRSRKRFAVFTKLGKQSPIKPLYK